jgi:hypothetical protein
MKKLILTGIAFCAFVIPSLAQEDIEAPLTTMVIKKAKVPAEVVTVAEEDFQNGEILEWYSFPYKFQEYGWKVEERTDPDVKGPVDHYAVQAKAENGSRIEAVYSADGKLIRMREVLKNTKLPEGIQTSLATGKYKSWKIVGDKEIIKEGTTNTKYYGVKVEKGDKNKVLYFDPDGKMLHS